MYIRMSHIFFCYENFVLIKENELSVNFKEDDATPRAKRLPGKDNKSLNILLNTKLPMVWHYLLLHIREHYGVQQSYSVLLNTSCYKQEEQLGLCCPSDHHQQMLHWKFKSHSTSPDVAQLGTHLDCNPEVAGSSQTVRHYFSPNNVRLLVYTSLQVKTYSQNDWIVTNQIEYTGFRQDSYL